jgi:hypothetical protein
LSSELKIREPIQNTNNTNTGIGASALNDINYKDASYFQVKQLSPEKKNPIYFNNEGDMTGTGVNRDQIPSDLNNVNFTAASLARRYDGQSLIMYNG